MTPVPRAVPSSTELVVAGASAGAIEALRVVFAGLRPDHPPMAIVVHVPSHTPSLLPSLFGEVSAFEAEDKRPLERGAVYFAPPDYHLLVEPDGVMSLNADPPVNFSRPAIDVLFDSAAAAYGARVVGVLLTGASSDGAEGLEAIHAAGGFTVVQHPDTAMARAMPQAALRRFTPDRVLDLNGIRDLLAELGPRRTP
jgi:two-component system chemotaxis response regulator CheB